MPYYINNSRKKLTNNGILLQEKTTTTTEGSKEKEYSDIRQDDREIRSIPFLGETQRTFTPEGGRF